MAQNPSPSEAGPDPLIGRTVGSYRITRLLGQGSFARVYLAQHPIIGSQVAIKIAELHATGNDELLQRFIGEARVANMISHENVVRIFDINVLDGNRHYFVMEYLQGEALGSAMEASQLSFEEARDIALQVCDGLAAAHAAGVVHRDLKPDNIFLVRADGKTKVKIVDFGIARRSQLGLGEKRTTVGTVLGTPFYMSPEQAFGLPVDGRADVYSLGVILFQLATGRLPFEHANMTDVLRAHALTPPPAPRSLNPAIDPAHEQLILRCMAKKPENRFPSMGELGRALRALAAPAAAPLPLTVVQPSAPPAPLPLTEPVAQIPLEDGEEIGHTVASDPAQLTPEAQVLGLLHRLDSVADEDPYLVLGVQPDADFAEVRNAYRKAGVTLEFVPHVKLGAEELGRVQAIAARLRQAAGVLVDPAARAAHDAARGNYLGVGRCIAAGLPEATLAQLRQKHLASRPNVSSILKPVLKRLAEAEGRADSATALQATAMALRLDPLNLELQRKHERLRERAAEA